MTTYVFSLGLIPVQEWIGEARRSRDLRAGSAFLSHLMARLLAPLAARPGAEVLLPAAPPGSSFAALAASFGAALAAPYGIPNRASGYLEATDDAEVDRWLRSLAREAVEEGWRELKGHLSCPRHASKEEREFWDFLATALAADRAATAKGEDCPFSVLWIAAPARHPREDTRENLRDVDLLFSALKRSRPVLPGLPGRAIGKCNQCGRREAIGPAESFAKWREWHDRSENLAWVQRGRRLDRGERLCCVCLAKRMAVYAAGESSRFPSTGEVAARLWLRRAREASEDEQLAGLIKSLEETDLGRADLGLALRASSRTLCERGASDAADLQRQIRARIRELRQKHAKHGDAKSADPDSRGGEHAQQASGLGDLPLEPPSYLALLTFDGDDMGRRVRAEPRGIPAGMTRFAESARRLLGAHGAEAFYLGGDEGLLMAPAAPALDLALALRAAFGEVFGEQLTLSMGIAFFEHTRPMAGAISAARAVLAAAKAHPDGEKDALGLTVETASGNVWPVVERWGPFWDRLQRAAGLVREGRLASGWAHDAEQLVGSLPEDSWRDPDLPAAVRAEVRRLLFRRLVVTGATAEERRNARQETWNRLGGESWWSGPADRLPRALPEQFHLIAFLARQGAEGAAR